ncbi:hypothetical protein SPRA44_750029 [Serratia proteamaculans]|nr:hypothetical protein SPRA44_750029 [Serratia proteamaculans]
MESGVDLAPGQLPVAQCPGLDSLLSRLLAAGEMNRAASAALWVLAFALYQQRFQQVEIVQ